MSEQHRARQRLERLLGPTGPELSCDECFAVLDRHVEAVLSGRQADEAFPGMREHLIGCPACAEDHASLVELLHHEERA